MNAWSFFFSCVPNAPCIPRPSPRLRVRLLSRRRDSLRYENAHARFVFSGVILFVLPASPFFFVCVSPWSFSGRLTPYNLSDPSNRRTPSSILIRSICPPFFSSSSSFPHSSATSTQAGRAASETNPAQVSQRLAGTAERAMTTAATETTAGRGGPCLTGETGAAAATTTTTTILTAAGRIGATARLPRTCRSHAASSASALPRLFEDGERHNARTFRVTTTGGARGRGSYTPAHRCAPQRQDYEVTLPAGYRHAQAACSCSPLARTSGLAMHTHRHPHAGELQQYPRNRKNVRFCTIS